MVKKFRWQQPTAQAQKALNLKDMEFYIFKNLNYF